MVLSSMAVLFSSVRRLCRTVLSSPQDDRWGTNHRREQGGRQIRLRLAARGRWRLCCVPTLPQKPYRGAHRSRRSTVPFSAVEEQRVLGCPIVYHVCSRCFKHSL
ncbi:hypothetical protein HDK64DRAFT_284750 [Phyllosticta capitalensis]